MNMTTTFDEIAAKLDGGIELSGDEARMLSATADIITLGSLADDVRRRLHGDRVTFCRVAELTLDETVDPAVPEIPAAARELRIVGVPDSLDRAMDFAAAVVAQATGRRVSAFSLSDLRACATGRGVPLQDLLARLKGSGVEAIAEAPADAVEIPDAVAVADAGLQIARITVSTAPVGDWLALFSKVTGLRAALDGILAFQPLPRRVSRDQPSTGYDDVKVVALARMLVRGVSSIQVDWALYGPKLAQVALTFGADDIDAVSPFDNLDLGVRRAPLEEVRRNIRAASMRAVERDGRFGVIEP